MSKRKKHTPKKRNRTDERARRAAYTPPAPSPDAPAPPLGRVPMRHGRIPTLTAELSDRIAAFVRAGNVPEVAAAVCGVPRPTLINWMREGHTARRAVEAAPDDTEPELTDAQARALPFLSAIEGAMAQAEAADVMAITKAAAKDWRAGEFLLKHRPGSKQRWKPVTSSTVEVEGVLGVVTSDAGPNEDARAFVARKLEQLAKAAAEKAAREAVEGEGEGRVEGPSTPEK